jgi:GTPase involved in cell partitioning and DNA repair
MSGWWDFPTPGKSTMILAHLGGAPEDRDYPFTTLVPTSAWWAVGDRSFRRRGRPGLIEGAHAGTASATGSSAISNATKVLVHWSTCRPRAAAIR